jgi:hypothetical protein
MICFYFDMPLGAFSGPEEKSEKQCSNLIGSQAPSSFLLPNENYESNSHNT